MRDPKERERERERAKTKNPPSPSPILQELSSLSSGKKTPLPPSFSPASLSNSPYEKRVRKIPSHQVRWSDQIGLAAAKLGCVNLWVRNCPFPGRVSRSAKLRMFGATRGDVTQKPRPPFHSAAAFFQSFVPRRRNCI